MITITEQQWDEVAWKAKAYDFLAECADEINIQYKWGGSDWLYPTCDPTSFKLDIINAMKFEHQDPDEE